MSHDDQVQIRTIEYRDIPPGRYQRRALVLEPGGVWDGSLAARTIEVE